MNVEFISQPDTQLGRVLLDLLNSEPSASRIIFVSAFVGLQAISRIKLEMLRLKQNEADIRFIIGIDLGGTSQEVLKELLEWGIDVRIVKHRIPGHTFHPKLYLFQWTDRAIIIIGSNNITDGGFFGNYESAIRVTYQLPDESKAYASACAELSRFIEPRNPVTYSLTPQFLNELIARGDVPSEAEARKGRDIPKSAKKAKGKKGKPIFGIENIPSPPPLPASFLEDHIKKIRIRRQAATKGRAREKAVTPPIDAEISDLILPTAFYMTLPTLQGENIPGESRIPLEAIELAKGFWGWPDKYSKKISPRSGKNRIYWDWRPQWRVWSVEAPQDVVVKTVRMYMYENSSDFRFYVRPLVNAGGNLGDVVRIRRIADSDVEFECVLARQGTLEYDEWITSCTQPVHHSERRFGYA